MPVAWVPWLDMKVDGLMPTDYWRQPVEDMQIARAVQDAVRTGEARADAEARREREAERAKAEQARREREAEQRLRARMGG